MPAGDPAAYNLNTVRSRLKRGQPAYQPRRKAGVSPAQQRTVEGELERAAKGGQRSFQPVKPGKVGNKVAVPYRSRRSRGL